MTAAVGTRERSCLWSHPELGLHALLDPAGSVRFGAPDQDWAALVPLVEITATGHGRLWSGERFIETAIGDRLVYRDHETVREGGRGGGREADREGCRGGDRERTTIRLADPVTGLVAEVVLETAPGAGFLRSHVRLVNEGDAPVRLESVSTLTLGGITDAGGGLDGLTLHWADNDWLTECRWRAAPFRDQVVSLSRFAHGRDGRGCFERSSQGSWSTGRHLPMGALTDGSGRAWLWQIESSAGWRYETGEREGAAYVALFGPDDAHHQWRHALAPGEEFRTVPAVLVRGEMEGLGGGGHGLDEEGGGHGLDGEGGGDGLDGEGDGGEGGGGAEGGALAAGSGGGPEAGSGGGLDAAFGELTDYRRRFRRDHPDHRALPVIYNDYMNTLMGDPTTAKLLPLVEAAGRAGAEVFVIDAGWYDDDAQGWWDSVGAWEPARARFPGGIQEVLDAIRAHGMVPGLWLEPEVVGVRSPLADTLPPEAFFRRGGVRVTEHGRHHLDLRHPAARAHLDAVVDRLVGEWGVGYLKLDYNINIGPGTENGAESPGAGLLGHHRAHLDWMNGLLDRHPGLVLENCGSGGLRMDYAQLAVAQLQSTSDQQDPLRCPPIAAAAATAVTPEQAAMWAYPQPDHTPHRIALTLTGALLGRVHLSGFLDRMDGEQFELVRSAIRVYKDIRPQIATARPFWPLGLPGWEDAWIAHGLRGPESTLVALWRRERADVPESRTLALPHLRGVEARPEVLQPTTADATAEWDAGAGRLTVRLPRTDTAVLLRFGGGG